VSPGLLTRQPPVPAPTERVVHRELLRSSYSLLANTAVTAVLGMGFWVAAARLYPAATVGRDTVLVSVLVELSVVCQLNLATGLVRFMPAAGARTARMLRGAYALSGVAALLLGGAFVLLAPGTSTRLAFLHTDPLLATVFVAALALWGVFALQDAALTATRRARWVPVENGIFGVLKLAALPALVLLGSEDGVFLAWVLPMAVLLVPVNVLLYRVVLPRASRPPAPCSPAPTAGALRFLGQDYLGAVLAQAALTALPLLALARLGAARSAYFAIPFTVVLAFDTFAQGACGAFVAEGARERGTLAAPVGVFCRRVLAPVAAAAVALVAAAPLVLAPFGDSYVRHGTLALRLLLLASLARLALALFAALSRVRLRGLRIAAGEAALAAVAVAAAAVLAPGAGVEGVAAGWLGANVLVAVAVTPVLLAELRGRSVQRGAVWITDVTGGGR
jgi:hypothetical protein